MKRKGKRWRKVGGGVHRLADGRKIRNGKVFWAEEDEIPPAFRDVIEEYPEPEPEPKKVATAKKATKVPTRTRTKSTEKKSVKT